MIFSLMEPTFTGHIWEDKDQRKGAKLKDRERHGNGILNGLTKGTESDNSLTGVIQNGKKRSRHTSTEENDICNMVIGKHVTGEKETRRKIPGRYQEGRRYVPRLGHGNIITTRKKAMSPLDKIT